jgi:5-methylcytosine-specific restriction endonuclease McrBC regulatory subunit McrC
MVSVSLSLCKKIPKVKNNRHAISQKNHVFLEEIRLQKIIKLTLANIFVENQAKDVEHCGSSL